MANFKSSTSRSGAVASLGLLSIFALSGCLEESDPSQAAAAPPPPAVSVAKPLVKKIVEDDEFVGRFEAVDSVQVRARIGGYLEQIHFTDGSMVEKGDLLFTIDRRPYRTLLAEAEANLKIAESQVAYTRKQLDRAEELSSRGNMSVSLLDERRQEHVSALAQVEAAKATVERAQLDLEYTEIRAPLSGRIDRKLISVGNLVEPNDTVLTSIVALDPIYFYFDIDERSYLAYSRDARERGVALQEGAGSLPIRVTLADTRAAPHYGHLDFAENRLDQGSGTARVRAVLENPDFVLQPGLFGRINVPGSLPYRGVLIPDEAIGADQDRRIVYVVDAEGKVSAKQIRPGPRIDGYRVVRDGLSGEETIVVNGLMRVRPGVTVTPQPVELPPKRQ
ncbi:MAG: efflux RND transporter periplasmic adaptor subunit [Kiloniellales bacterium]